jgi:DNA-binding MarR family transcriptional regulator
MNQLINLSRYLNTPERYKMNNRFAADIKATKKSLESQNIEWAESAVHEIFAATNVFENYIDTKHAKHGLAQISIAILYTLVLYNGKLSQKRIAKLVNRSKQRVASILANLEKRNLVTREIQGHDQRRRLVRITEEGLKVAQECLPYRIRFYNALISSVTREEIESIVPTLSKIRTNIVDDLKRSIR